MSKNILIINEYAGSPSYGMTFRHFYLAKEFIKKGHATTIVSGSYSHFLKKYPDMDAKIFRNENVEGVNFLWVKVIRYTRSYDKKRVFKWFEFASKLFFISKHLQAKPDVIICSSTPLFAILPAYYLAKKYKAKLVFEVRDVWPLTLISIGKFSENNLFIRFMGWFEKFSLQKSDLIVSNLSNYTQHIQELGIDRKAFWISNGIDLDEMTKTEKLPTEIESKIPRDKFIVGYTGKLGVSNAIIYLLQAAKILEKNNNIVFVIVGNGQEKQYLQSFAKDLENVIFIDTVNKTQIPLILELFDVCFLGWKKEELYKFGVSPNKLFDYMYSSTPILQAIDIKNDIVEKSHCGVCVEAENIEAIAGAVMQLYNMNDEERKTLGQNAKRHVLENFTYEKLADRFLSILETRYYREKS